MTWSGLSEKNVDGVWVGVQLKLTQASLLQYLFVSKDFFCCQNRYTVIDNEQVLCMLV